VGIGGDQPTEHLGEAIGVVPDREFAIGLALATTPHCITIGAGHDPVHISGQPTLCQCRPPRNHHGKSGIDGDDHFRFGDQIGATDNRLKRSIIYSLIDLSPVHIDDIVFTDIFAALAQSVDSDLWYDADFGIDNLVQTTYTLPTANETDVDDIYGYLGKAINFISTTRFLPPDVIFAHPSVVNHILTRLDPDGRPLVLPSTDALNPLAMAPNSPVAQGESLRILGLPVISDPNITTSGNTSAVYVARLADSILFTNGPVAFASPQPLAIQLSWLLRVHTYLAPVHRYPEASIVKVANFNTGIPFGS
jgi:hypothetical protein